MQALLVAAIGKIFEILLNVLLIPQIKEWAKKRKRDQEIKDLVKENRKKEEAYENSSPDTAHDDFRRLP